MNLPGWCPALWQPIPAKFHGPLFEVEPWLLVIHSGSKAAGVAEYFARKSLKRKVSTQIAWSKIIDDFVQCLPLDTVAWHVGGSRLKGQGKLNFQSIGIELPGPYDKSRLAEKDRIVRCVEGLYNLLPSLTTVVRHSDINPKKKDPGRGFHEEWISHLGLDMPFA